MPRPLSELHQSQATCLARVKFEHDDPQPSGDAAVVGTIVHQGIEQFTYESAAHSDLDPVSVIREVMHPWIPRADAPPHVIEDAALTLARILGRDSAFNFRLRPGGWVTKPEWRWALDEELEPIAPCDHTLGEILPSVDENELVCCARCRAHPGWSSAPAFAGAIDRLEYHADLGEVDLYDWKTLLVHESGADLAGKRQPRWYATAVLAHFPDVQRVTFREAMLRHNYTASWTFERKDAWHEQTRLGMLAERTRRLAAIESESFPETPGLDCRWCPILFRCGVKEKARAIGQEPAGDPTELAGIFLWTKALLARLEPHLRGIVKVTGEPIPLGYDGKALGKKPVAAWEMAKSYERTMAQLEALGMTTEQRVEWFRYVRESDLASRVKKAIVELVGRKHAARLIDAGGWLEPIAVEEFAVHTPEERVPPAERGPVSIEELDALIDNVFGGG